MSHQTKPTRTSHKAGVLFATGMLAASMLATMPTSHAVDTGSFGTAISAEEASKALRTITADKTSLLEAVERAKAAGLTVNELPLEQLNANSTAEIRTLLDEILAGYNAKIADIDQAIADYEADKKDAADYAKDKAAYDAYLSEKKKIEEGNAKLKADYEAETKRVQALIDQHAADYAQWKKDHAAYMEKVEKAKQALADGKCEAPVIGATLDLSRSMENSEVQTAKDQLIDMVKKPAVPGTKFVLMTFGRTAPVNFAPTADQDGAPTGPTTEVAGNQPSVTFDIGTAEGKQAAINWINGIDKKSKDAPIGLEDWSGVNSDTIGTNWDAALRQAKEYQDKNNIVFDKLLLVTDGAPTAYIDDEGQVVLHVDTPATNSSSIALAKAQESMRVLEATGADVVPVVIRDEAIGVEGHPFGFASDQEALIELATTVSGVDNPVLGEHYFVGDMGDMAETIYDAANKAVEQCLVKEEEPKEPVQPPQLPEEPDYQELPTPVVEPKDPGEAVAPVIEYKLSDILAPIPVVEKVAKDEGKKVIAGEVTTQTVTYATDYKAPVSFAIGDNIYFTEDGRMPVSVDMNQVAVTDADGNNVTDQFTITATDTTWQGKQVHQILAEAKDPASLKLNHSYTLHINQTSLFDGQADLLVDSGFAIVDDEIQWTTDKTYYEPKINPDKTAVNSEGVEVDNTRVLPGQELNYKLRLSADDLKDTSSGVDALGKEDNYDETKWEPTKQFTVVNDQGEDFTDQFTATWEEGKVLIMANNPSQMVGSDYTITLMGHVRQDATPGEFTNQAVQITNQDRTLTKVVRNYVPVITPSKSGTSAIDGSNIDGKNVVVGDVISYKLVEDTTELENTADPIKVSGMHDDFDERYGTINPEDVRVYQVPGDTDTSTPEKVSAALKLSEAKDVTDSYTITLGEIEGFEIGGKVGMTSLMKADADGKLVLPMGYKYIHVLPYTVTANADGDILNTAWQVTNDHKVQTETVANTMKKITPSKDVVIKVGDKDSVDGTEIALNTVFNYALNSSTLPADRADGSSPWFITDDYDEAKDKYEGHFLVHNTHPFVDAEGKTVEAGSDITKYFEQKHENGKVTYTANKDYLALMSTEANRATEQGFTVYMQVERIGTGEVLNTFVESYNGYESNSNTVKTTTPEPQTPPVVVTPEDPANPESPKPQQPSVVEKSSEPAVVKGEGAETGGEAKVSDAQAVGAKSMVGVLASLLAALAAILGICAYKVRKES